MSDVSTASTTDRYPVTARDRRIAGLAALAVAIHILEATLPSPLPGLKPGLANVVTLVVMLRWGLADAVWVAVLRVLVGSLMVGSFMTPAFLLSAAGAGAALIALAGLHLSLGRRVSGIGLGVAMALAHTAAQFAVAYTLFLPHPGLFKLLPVLLTAALVFGVLGGIIANMVRHGLEQP